MTNDEIFLEIRKVRKYKKISQVKLAEMAGLTELTVANIELGKVSNPGFETVRKLIDALGMRMEAYLPQK